MTVSADQYVLDVVRRYSVQAGVGSSAEQAGQAVNPILAQWSGQQLVEIKYSGSYAKGTAIAGGTDVDLFISLKSDTSGTLKELYFSLRDFVRGYGYTPELRNVSIRIKYNNTEVDLVPGRKQSAYTNDHSLYRRRADTWTQTNIDKHIEIVRNSSRTVEIKAIKIWKQVHRLDFPSFYLELSVLRAIQGTAIGNYASNVMRALNWIGDNLETAVLFDPANTNNLVSSDLTGNEKAAIARQASASANQQYWEKIIW